jgi:hypothetical protein
LFGEDIPDKSGGETREKRRDRSLVTQDALSLRRRRREAVVVAISRYSKPGARLFP